MQGYRHAPITVDANTLTEPDVHELLAQVLQPQHFILGHGLELQSEWATTKTMPWELFHGRLLPPGQTRQERTFQTWQVYLLEDGIRSEQPLLALNWDREAQTIYVTRGIRSYIWEGYQGEGNVFLSREVQRWVNELVGTVDLSLFCSKNDLEDELAGRLFEAVVGLSRLPLTSVESPLPGFALGQLAYFYHENPASDSNQPIRSWQTFLDQARFSHLSAAERIKLTEWILRHLEKSQLAEAAKLFLNCWNQTRDEKNLSKFLRTMVNDISLSPYTRFADNLLGFADELVKQNALTNEERVDFYSYILRHLVRHLTAYDLVHFHNRGANYPDALFLDSVLRRYLQLMEEEPELFQDNSGSRMRRRALRQAWLVRLQYTGHPVPDVPTSPGENARVMPDSFPRVSEEQLTQMFKRKKVLYEEADPLSWSTTALSVRNRAIADLQHPRELQELGMAVFIDRPLGVDKFPGEADQTMLFSHEAFSRSVALSRLELLQRKSDEMGSVDWTTIRQALSEMSPAGIPASEFHHTQPRVVSLADASSVVADFVFLRTTTSVVKEFLRELSQSVDCRFLSEHKHLLILPASTSEPQTAPKLRIYDREMQLLAEATMDLSKGWVWRGGREFPGAGWRVEMD